MKPGNRSQVLSNRDTVLNPAPVVTKGAIDERWGALTD